MISGNTIADQANHLSRVLIKKGFLKEAMQFATGYSNAFNSVPSIVDLIKESQRIMGDLSRDKELSDRYALYHRIARPYHRLLS